MSPTWPTRRWNPYPATHGAGPWVATGVGALGCWELLSGNDEIKVEGLSNLALAGSLLTASAHGHQGALSCGLLAAHGLLDLGLAVDAVTHEHTERALQYGLKAGVAFGSLAFPQAAPVLHMVLLGATAALVS